MACDIDGGNHLANYVKFSDCFDFRRNRFQRVNESRQFKPAFRSTRPPRPLHVRLLHSGNSAFFISRSEMNHGVIADITPSDLAIISRQVI
ncbi:MAG: hypothetical protein IOC39_14750 [Burkholderia sp.]|jgi:hypothetical protein|uniref:hypothetical protein n=1 Tax=Burkholderia TaxID=32008 RepID=UPI0015897D68|nr:MULTISPECIES: hypothetical protein [Burkholderia]MCA3779066.1 hypothetical protein [Burkholderia sp.]MCA3791800.1 hypothetical protein [Burkholderia sp.]MCA3803327.1 hypothetical protein [Burkholderia sp.]MCA3812719.1 hypothetical protein [Burkholderia sp.]MCA3817085.1 hypothetical protein [Burkholderia sp.]